MSEILDRIVNCDISIDKPVMDSASFGTVLIMVMRRLMAEKTCGR